MYIQAQMAYQRIVSDQAWTQANSVQHGAVIKANLGTYNGGILYVRLLKVFIHRGFKRDMNVPNSIHGSCC
jgi:hypothetical protein